MRIIIFLIICAFIKSFSQVNNFPYFQNFDSSYIIPPSLPTGWRSTQNRIAGSNDFTTTTSTTYSAPNCIISTNSKIQQILFSPFLNFSQKYADSIKFFERRSSTHDAGFLLEASTDGGNNFNIKISDTLKNPGHTNYIERKFKLPSELNNQSNVLIRWNILGNGTGSTATIRFDDVLITAEIDLDIGIKSFHTTPTNPSAGDSVIVTLVVKNFGNRPIQFFEVVLFIDANYDSIPQAYELYQSFLNETLLNKNDTVVFHSVVPWLGLNPMHLISKLNLEGDGNISNNIKLYQIKFGVKRNSIVINEIMYRPNAPEPEWIEITNRTSDIINLLNWKVSDSKVTSRHLITNKNYFIKPKEFVIITKDTLSLIEVRQYLNVKLFHVSTLPALNNDSDAVVIYDDLGTTIDSVYYRASWGGSSGGKSLERINQDLPSHLKSNWGTSIHPEGCTPGKINSISQKDYDLKISNITFCPEFPFIDDTVQLNVKLKNVGKNVIDNFSLNIYYDENRDSICSNHELIDFFSSYENLNVDDSINLSFRFVVDSVKEYNFIARVIYSEDQDTLNNIFYSKLLTGYKIGSVVINEIMYAPSGGEPEWIELYNNYQNNINLKDWKLSNRNSLNRYKIIASNFTLGPNEYLIITKDTSLFLNYRSGVSNIIEANSLPTYFLNNSSDAVVLFDNRNVRIDSVYYISSWGGTHGFSLERIESMKNSQDSTNWGTSLDSSGATPGRQNYLTPLEYDIQLIDISWDSIHSFNEVSISVTAKNVGRKTVYDFILKIFYDQNKDSVSQEEELIYSEVVKCILNYCDTINKKFVWKNFIPGSKNIIVLIDFDNDMRKKDNKKFITLFTGYPTKSLVINEIMFQPLTGNSEYVELFNRTNFSVELRYWKLHDFSVVDSKQNEFKLGNTNLILNPGEYLVLAADSNIYSQYSYLKDTNYKIFIFNKSSLSLNNEGDIIIIRDLLNNLIDSVCYDPSWHNPEISDFSGRSLERINTEIESNDKRNWSTCTEIFGGTPGRQNSIFASTLSQTGELSFYPNPFSPDADGFEDFCIISYKTPVKVAMINVKIFDSKGRLVRMLANNEASGSEGKLIWDGFNDEKIKVNMGIYIVLLEVFDVELQKNYRYKGVVVVGSRL